MSCQLDPNRQVLTNDEILHSKLSRNGSHKAPDTRYFWKYLLQTNFNRFTPLSKSQTHIKCNFRRKKNKTGGEKKEKAAARSTCKWYIRNFQQFFKCSEKAPKGALVLAWLPQVNYLSQLDVRCRFLYLFAFAFCFFFFFSFYEDEFLFYEWFRRAASLPACRSVTPAVW